MAKKSPKIQIRSVLIAEDVRHEATGQQTIIGVYGNSISTAQSVLKLPRVVFRIEFISQEKIAAQCQFSVVSPSGKVVFSTPQPINMEVQPGITAICSVGWSPVELTEQGHYEIRFGVDGKAKKVSSFQINLNAEPPQNKQLQGGASK